MVKKILIVEDNEDTLSFMKYLIESYGCQAIEASDGIEALDKFKKHQPDIILMDISLPTVGGLTATKAIREVDATGKVPIIAVTAFGKTYREQAIEAGCDDLISKPFDFDVLHLLIEKHLTSE
jgi:two-component system phosphate regulon response regulator PhoB